MGQQYSEDNAQNDHNDKSYFMRAIKLILDFDS